MFQEVRPRHKNSAAFDHFYIPQKTRESKKEIGEIRESSFSDSENPASLITSGTTGGVWSN